MDHRNFGKSTAAIHAGTEGKNSEHHPVNTPVYLSSTFAFPTQAHGAAIFAGESNGFTYGRLKNPTTVDIENRLAVIEGAEECALFSSGMAAVTTLITTLVKSGDHIVADDCLYGGSHSVMTHKMHEMNIGVTLIDMTNPENLRNAIQPNTKLIFFETPTNPTLRIIPIKDTVEIAKQHGILTAIDATFMSPILMRPLEMGVDLVLHSVTKYLNGHSDIIGGAVLGNTELLGMIKMQRVHLGGIMDPFSAYLLGRGIKTLKIRMKQHEINGKIIADFLKSHPMVKKIDYLGHEDHPQHELAKSQQDGFGSMMTFEIDGDFEQAVKFVDSLEIITRAVSLGGVESLLTHPASTTHSDIVMSPEDRAEAGISDTMMRLSVGIEDVEDLIADLEQAFGKITKREHIIAD